METIFNWQNCFASLFVGYMGNGKFVLEIVTISFSVLVSPGLKLETASLSELWKLADDWLCERPPEITSLLVTVRSKCGALFSANSNQIEQYSIFNSEPFIWLSVYLSWKCTIIINEILCFISTSLEHM